MICGDKIEIYEYDSLGRLARKKEPFEDDQIKVTCLAFDFLDCIIEEWIENEIGEVLKKIFYQCDVEGNRTHVIEESAAELSSKITEFNSDKKPIKIIDQNGNETHFSYNYTFLNELNQLVLQTTITDPIGRQTIKIYDAQEKVVMNEHRNFFGVLLQKQEFVCDEMKNIILIIDHEILSGQEIRRIESAFKYNKTGQVTFVTKARGLPEQQITHLKYNKFGEKKSVTKPNGIVLNFEYDALGRLSHYYSSDKSLAYKYAYNERNDIVRVDDLILKTASEFEYDLRGRLLTEQLANGVPISYEYDLLDRAICLKLPDHNSVQYHYDAVNLKEIRRYKKNELLYTHHYEIYDTAGLNLRSNTINQSKITYTYDRFKRPISVEGKTFKQNNAQYDPVGHLLKYNQQDLIGSFQVDLDYSDLDQLIGEDGHRKHTYGCNSLHHRIFKDEKKSTFNALHQLLTNGEFTQVYDRAGNLIHKEKGDTKITYDYDANDRLVKVNSESITNYIYDSFHRRIAKVTSGKTIRYIYSGQDEIGSIDESGKIVELRILGKGHGAEIGASIAIEIGDTIYSPSHDFQGNIISLEDLKGNIVESYRYTTFGETTVYDATGREVAVSIIKNPWQFSSKRLDIESGFVYFGRRYYDPENGYWVTADPAELIDGTNLYAYLHHNPVGAWDLYGLFEQTTESNQWTYYPLNEVDRRDGTYQKQFEKDFKPNEVPDDLVLKRSGKKGKSYCCGYYDAPNIRYYSVHGIDNKLATAYESAKKLSDQLDGARVHFTVNERSIVIHDVFECAMGLYLHMKTDRVKNVEKELLDLSAGVDYVYTRYHSGGAIEVRNSVKNFDRTLQQKMILEGYAPAAYINPKYAFQINQYRSERDFVPLFDIVGLYKNWNSVQVLRPHPKANFLDHPINSPTFEKHQKQNPITISNKLGVML